MTDYYKLRHDIFVDERGWSALRKPSGLEIDQYDDEHAVYLLALDDRRVVGGLRLYPTERPHMLTDSFSHLASRPIPRGPAILECTRYFVVPGRRGGRTDGRLMAAVQRFCLDHAVTHLTAVVETWWLPRWRQCGFKVRPLGLPQDVEGEPTIAVSLDISEDTFRAVSARTGLRREVTLVDHRATAEIRDAA